MGFARVDMYDQEGRVKPLDAWFFYAALFTDGPSQAYVKLGISTIPFSRANTLITGCPFQLDTLLFDRVGDRSRAAQLEAACKRIFADRRTRGEWYKFAITEPADKDAFHKGLRAAFFSVIGRGPVWRSASRRQVQDFAFAFGHRGELSRSRS